MIGSVARGTYDRRPCSKVRRTLPVAAVAPPPWAACHSTTCRGGAGAAMCARRCTCSPTPSSSRSLAGRPSTGTGTSPTPCTAWSRTPGWTTGPPRSTSARSSATPQEAALVDIAVLRVLRIMHQVGADAPVSAYLEHHGWPEAVRAAREAHVRLAASDGEDPDVPPRSLEVLRDHDAGRVSAGRRRCRARVPSGRLWRPCADADCEPVRPAGRRRTPRRRAVRPHALLPGQAGHRARRVELPLHDRLQHRGQPAVRRPRHGSVLHAGPLLGGAAGDRGEAAGELRRDRRLLPDGLADPPGRRSGCGSS